MAVNRTHYAIILISCSILCSCSDNKKAEQNTVEESDIAQSGPGDANVLIGSFQEHLKPAGKPLSELQIAQIKERYSPLTADEDMKIVMGLLTSDQKKILVDNLEKELEQLGYPLTRMQVKLYMEYGPESTVNWTNILTDEQNKAMMRQK